MMVSLIKSSTKMAETAWSLSCLKAVWSEAMRIRWEYTVLRMPVAVSKTCLCNSEVMIKHRLCASIDDV